MQEYKKQAETSKAKYSMAQRNSQKSKGDIVKATGSYSLRFLFLATNDEVLYKYKRKLQKEMQWKLLEM